MTQPDVLEVLEDMARLSGCDLAKLRDLDIAKSEKNEYFVSFKVDGHILPIGWSWIVLSSGWTVRWIAYIPNEWTAKDMMNTDHWWDEAKNRNLIRKNKDGFSPGGDDQPDQERHDTPDRGEPEPVSGHSDGATPERL